MYKLFYITTTSERHEGEYEGLTEVVEVAKSLTKRDRIAILHFYDESRIRPGETYGWYSNSTGDLKLVFIRPAVSHLVEEVA